MEKKRGFEVIREDMLPFDKDGVWKPSLPLKSTNDSAGYDFKSLSAGVIEPNQTVVCRTGIKAYMQKGEYLSLNGRSSLGAKHGVVLANTVGIVDRDYYGNPDNDGEILVVLKNTSKKAFEIHIGDKIAQGIFQSYLEADEGTYVSKNAERVGGFGSTGK